MKKQSADILQRFTTDAHAALAAAQQAARIRHAPYVDVEHILLGLLQSRQEPLAGIFTDADREQISARVNAELGVVREQPLEQLEGLTTAATALLTNAYQQAKGMGQNFVNGGHLLLAMFGQDSIGRFLEPLQPESVKTYVAANSPAPQKVEQPVRVIFERPRAPQIPIPRRFSSQGRGNSQIVYYLIAALAGVVLYLAITNPQNLISFGVVLVGWIFSLTLHEFSHAIVAYWGGDYTVREKGYLTFNPLRYTHPLLSIGLPLIFLAMGGIGLPGGAVYIEEHRLRSKSWRTAVSLAGPFSNALLAVIFAAPFWLGFWDAPTILFVQSESMGRLQAGIAALVFLQITAVFLNLLPIPPLDGFNALSPYMSRDIVNQARSFGLLALLLIFYLFRVEAFSDAFFNSVYDISTFLQVPWNLVREGIDLFIFWS